MYKFRGDHWLSSNEKSFQIKIIGENWGGARIVDVQCLLEYITRVFLQHIEMDFDASIYVDCRPLHLSPEVHCRSEINNEHIITVANNEYWWVTDQFAHELCHILSGYKKLDRLPNRWFHESLCQLASIFILRHMTTNCCDCRVFSQSPSSKDVFRSFSDYYLTRQDFQLPENVALSDWFKLNESSLRADQYQRGKNGVVSLQLLPLIEDHPKYWQSICFMPDSDGSFEEFLHEWQNQCPHPAQKRFPAEVSNLFGFKSLTHQVQ